MKLVKPILVAGMLISALPAFAQTSVTAELPNKDGGKACVGKCGFGAKLNLSQDQKDKLGSLRDQFTLNTAKEKAELKVAHNELRRLFEQPTIDKQAALSLQTKINGMKDDLSNQRLNMILASSDVLTPEQRAEFAKMRAMGGFRHHHRHGGFGREGGREHGGPKVG